MTASQFPDYLGVIGVGDGKVVFPSPEIATDANEIVRGYGDGSFTWPMVTGLEPEPDNLGYQFREPVSYRLEITPDLGWQNTETMFEPYMHGQEQFGNAMLSVHRDLVVGVDLVNNGDETVTYTISERDMKKILAPGFKRYLWRVTAVSAENHRGHWSTIQEFTAQVVVSPLAWTLEFDENASRFATLYIHGDRDPNVVSIEVSGEAQWTFFPSHKTWAAEVPLSGGRNFFTVRAFDAQGNGSNYRSVEVEKTSNKLTDRSYFNRFDDFGYKMGLKRLPRESNLDYRTRIQDVLVHRASPTYLGMMNGVARELNLTYYDQALLISSFQGTESTTRDDNIVVWMGSEYFYVHKLNNPIQYEYHRIGGRSWRVRPREYVVEGPFLVESAPGVPVPPDDYKVMTDKDGLFIQFLKREWSAKVVYLSYPYAERVSVIDKTVTELTTELEALRFNGQQVVSIVVDSDISDARAEGLQRFPPAILNRIDYLDAGGRNVDAQPVRWLPVELDAFMDDEFKNRFRNDKGSMFGTKYAGWAWQIKKQLRTTWGLLVADEAVWSHPIIRTSGLGSLDHVYDAWRSEWSTTRGDVAHGLTPEEAAAASYRDPRDRSLLKLHGLSPWWVQSGFGFWRSLFTLIDIDNIITEFGETGFETVYQRVTSEVSRFVDLGIGASDVDSASEVA